VSLLFRADRIGAMQTPTKSIYRHRVSTLRPRAESRFRSMRIDFVAIVGYAHDYYVGDNTRLTTRRTEDSTFQ
jgi:hypothetical protein